MPAPPADPAPGEWVAVTAYYTQDAVLLNERGELKPAALGEDDWARELNTNLLAAVRLDRDAAGIGDQDRVIRRRHGQELLRRWARIAASVAAGASRCGQWPMPGRM